METSDTGTSPVLLGVEPVLPVASVTDTISYWHNVLGFPAHWTWGEPPNHGAVSWHGLQIQFSLTPEVSAGQAIFINVRNLPALYAFHQTQGADIVDPLENKPWHMAGYTLRDINGHYINFGGALLSERGTNDAHMPADIAIVARTPTAEEYAHLIAAVGWTATTNLHLTTTILAAPVFAVVAQHKTSGQVVGCALLLSDNASVYYVKDVMVHPEWQGKRIGTTLMQTLRQWLDKHAPNNALATLITGENLTPFYRQVGFVPAFGMMQWIRKE
ncbi:GNAT family N-acetyltransferase [Chryseolinea lacunae]|uniref:GNAT family N-acetyltransferase n=1 Tax=Chryseolinea lacunae TaxID=2801331 RepID=A0ABS1KYP6_9BACT|nr:GNAT family N-acetyltransferase [Chryseolinea lacunae]MBL0744573.1 GNAT family N-acetyltransferase [Chryseolinea lacunae]